MPRTAVSLAACAFALTASLLGRVAHAQTPGSAEPPVPPPTAETYTLHILAADAASIGVLVIAGVVDDAGSGNLGEGIATMGVGGLLLGGPIVHAAHGHWGRSAISLGLRVVLPVLGASIGASTADCRDDQFLCGLSEAGMGLMIGEAAAIALDAGVLARWSAFQDPSEGHAQRGAMDRPDPRRNARPAALTFAPRIVATPERALVGIGGTFF